MEKETKRILKKVKGKEYYCGHCRECLKVEQDVDKIIKKIKKDVPSTKSEMCKDYCIVCGKRLRSAKEFDTCEQCRNQDKSEGGGK